MDTHLSHPYGEGLPYSQGKTLFTLIVEMGITTTLHYPPHAMRKLPTHHPAPKEVPLPKNNTDSLFNPINNSTAMGTHCQK